MAGVQTNPSLPALGCSVEEGLEVLEFVAQISALCGGSLEKESGLGFYTFFFQFFQA